MTTKQSRRLNNSIILLGAACLVLGLVSAIHAVAYAQGPPSVSPVTPAIAGAPSDPFALVQLLVSSAEAGHWRLAVGLGLAGLVMGLRYLAGKAPKVGDFIKTDRGGAIFTVLVVEAAAWAAVLLSSVKLSWAIDAKVTVNALAGSAGVVGIYTIIKRIAWPADRAQKPADKPVTLLAPPEGPPPTKIAA